MNFIWNLFEPRAPVEGDAAPLSQVRVVALAVDTVCCAQRWCNAACVKPPLCCAERCVRAMLAMYTMVCSGRVWMQIVATSLHCFALHMCVSCIKCLRRCCVAVCVVHAQRGTGCVVFQKISIARQLELRPGCVAVSATFSCTCKCVCHAVSACDVAA